MVDESKTAINKRGERNVEHLGSAGGAALVLEERIWDGVDASHGAGGEDLAMMPTKDKEGQIGAAGRWDEEHYAILYFTYEDNLKK